MKQKSFKLMSNISRDKGKEVVGGKSKNRKHFYHFDLGFGV